MAKNPLDQLIVRSSPKLVDQAYSWAAVTDTTPLTIVLDGTTDPLDGVPDTLVSVRTGDRVFVVMAGKRATIVGKPMAADANLHLVGSPGEPSYQNAWDTYNSSFGPARFERDGNQIYLGGLVRSGTAHSNNTGTVFILPEGYRPPYQEIFAAWSSAGTARVDVYTTGWVNVVSYGTGGTNSFVSLSGINFRAAGS